MYVREKHGYIGSIEPTSDSGDTCDTGANGHRCQRQTTRGIELIASPQTLIFQISNPRSPIRPQTFITRPIAHHGNGASATQNQFAASRALPGPRSHFATARQAPALASKLPRHARCWAHRCRVGRVTRAGYLSHLHTGIEKARPCDWMLMPGQDAVELAG